MEQELRTILRRFVESGWPLIAEPSAAWLDGRCSKEELVRAIEQAKAECGSCGCDLDPLYPRALALLAESGRMVYGKLVRDRIPEIIVREGFVPETRILTNEEMRVELRRKLREETEEYLESGETEELADLMEVVDALCAATGISLEDVNRIKAEKRAARGGFDKRVYLIAKE